MGEKLVVEVIGKRPRDTPYVRVADADGNFLGALQGREMRRLAKAILDALDGHKQP